MLSSGDEKYELVPTTQVFMLHPSPGFPVRYYIREVGPYLAAMHVNLDVDPVRVAALLQAKAMRVIIIERDEHTRSLHALRRAGHHVLIGDATREETLILAGGHQSRGILALTDHDASNLQIALIARTQNAKAPVLARIDSPLLCQHIAQDDTLTAFSPIAVAARAFANAVETLSADATGR